ncbi:AraC family transcriptional regulator [Methylobacterium variabile]|uniref:AraC family transcriptional regulator n=1 Tax=Methylobacterium variabile TaxID=298794 RepID=A0A0J6T2D7_9HYPH|nr:helix-turn-helix domain-containing protein [Methylobacterium variabile]KMO40169.1 AraC family transcriptional regulator [Methylobacterium variabile]
MRLDSVQPPAVPHFFLYGEAPRDADDRFLHLEALDDRSRPNRWTIRPHVHSGLHQLLLIAEGGGEMRAEAERHAFTAPCLLAVPAGTAHGFRFADGTAGTVLTLSARYLRDLCGREPALAALFSGPAALPLPEPGPVEEAVAELAREIAWAAPGRRGAIEAHLMLLLVASLRRLAATREPASPPGPQALLTARFRELVEAHHRRERPLGAYADDLGVTEARLRSACRAVAGTSPGQIIRERRLLEAKRSLLYSDLGIAEIAYSLGFSDPAYFSRFFAKGTGECPRAFRDRRGADRGEAR